MNRNSRLKRMSFLLSPVLLLLSATTMRAQRTIEFFEQDFSMDYAKHSVLYRQIGDKPPHYDQFRSNEAAAKGFRTVVKKQVLNNALYTTPAADSIVEALKYDNQGMLTEQHRKYFQEGKMVADSFFSLKYGQGNIHVTISALSSGQLKRVADKVYTLDAGKRITEVVVADKDGQQQSAISYEYNRQGFLVAGYKKSGSQRDKRPLFYLSYRNWSDNPAIRGGGYQGNDETKHHPAYLLYKEVEKLTPGQAASHIKYIVGNDSVSGTSSSFAFSPAMVYFLYDQICEDPVNHNCMERSGFYRWLKGELAQRSIYELHLPAPRLFSDAAANNYPNPGKYDYYNRDRNGMKTVKKGKIRAEMHQLSHDGCLFQYQYS